MKKLLSCLIFLFVCTASPAVTFLLPDDGSVQPRLLLDADVPHADTVDLSAADVIAEYDEKYFIYGDTLVCCRALGANEWLLAREGSVWRAGWNDRVTQRRLAHVMPYLPEGDAISECKDTLTVSYLEFTPESRPVASVTTTGTGCSFVTGYGDTIVCPVGVREEWTEVLPDGTEIHRISRRWHEPGQALAAVRCDTWSAGQLEWTVTSVPSPCGATPRSRSPRKDDGPGPSLSAGAYVRVYDVQGRLMLSGDATEISTGLLPSGVYIMETVSEGVSTVSKFRVK